MGDFNSEPNKRLRLTPPLASRRAGTETGKTGLEGFNSEPNKRLRLTRSLASRRAGTIIAADRAPRGKTRDAKLALGAQNKRSGKV